VSILAITLDGCMRIRQFANGKAVVELRGHLFPGDWIYCVYRSLTLEKAWDMFHNQAAHHTNINRFTKPVVSPGL
jgi:hypothetical protein